MGDLLTRQSSTAPQPDPLVTRFAIAAGIWAVAFGLLSVAWALGSDIGLNKLSPSLTDRFQEGNTADIVLLWATGIAKMAGGAVALLIAAPILPAAPRRPLVWLAWIGGIGCALYGIGDIVGGVIRWHQGTGENAIWYAILWGPIWLLGGLLFMATAWTRQRRGYR